MEILLVEDSPVDRLLAIEALGESGFKGRTHAVSDGREAVSFLRREGKHVDSPRPHLVLLDLNLPGKNGHEVLAEIKTDLELQDIPVVVFTSSDSEEDINRAYEERANCYVRKPTDFRGYRDVIQNIESFWGSVARLPQPRLPNSSPAKRPSSVTYGDDAEGPTIRVLLVEDNPTDVLMLGTELSDCGGVRFEVTDVPRLRDAIGVLATEHFDIVLTDLGLPDSCGLDTFVAINKAAQGLPVIVMTGLNDERIGMSAMRAGAQDYFVKGHLQNGLARAIRYAIERRRTAESLRRSEERFRASLESLLDGFALLAAIRSPLGEITDFRVDYINQCGRRRLENGLEVATLSDLFPDCRATAFFGDLVRVVETGKPFTRESILLCEEQAQGMTTPALDFRAVKFGDGIALSWRDATERLKLEAQVLQSQKMTSIGQLAGGIAHDFNNLLTVIHGHADVMTSGSGLPSQLRASVDGISEAAQRATNLTRQLLTFSRQHPMIASDIDMNETVAEMSNMLSRILGEDIALQLQFQQPAPFVRADVGMIEQILLNLAVNSRDAMPTGGKLRVATSVVNVTEADLETEPDVTPGRFACVTVGDNGCGIRADQLGKIFEPFFTTKEVGKGTGLGLATVYGIVKQHKGYIKVDSQPGLGTTFKVFLPCVEAPASIASSVAPTASPADGNATILFVEDEANIRQMAKMFLESHGYRVIEANNGAEALEIWRKHRDEIDLVLTDLVMPNGVSGHQLIEQLQSERPDLKVIFSSGYSQDLLGDDTFLRANTNFLQKPYRLNSLSQMIHDCLYGKQEAA